MWNGSQPSCMKTRFKKVNSHLRSKNQAPTQLHTTRSREVHAELAGWSNLRNAVHLVKSKKVSSPFGFNPFLSYTIAAADCAYENDTKLTGVPSIPPENLPLPRT